MLPQKLLDHRAPHKAQQGLFDQGQGGGHKLKLCPEEYLPIIEGAIDGAIKIEQPKKKETGDA